MGLQKIKPHVTLADDIYYVLDIWQLDGQYEMVNEPSIEKILAIS